MRIAESHQRAEHIFGVYCLSTTGLAQTIKADMPLVLPYKRTICRLDDQATWSRTGELAWAFQAKDNQLAKKAALLFLENHRGRNGRS
jgi:hypothetical protein